MALEEHRSTKSKWRDGFLERSLLRKVPAITATVRKRFVKAISLSASKKSAALSCAVVSRFLEAAPQASSACPDCLLFLPSVTKIQWSLVHLLCGVKSVEAAFPAFAWEPLPAPSCFEQAPSPKPVATHCCDLDLDNFTVSLPRFPCPFNVQPSEDPQCFELSGFHKS